MTRHRRDRPEPWRDWLLSALFGIGLALALIFCLGRSNRPSVPAQAPVSTPEKRGEADRSVGFEFKFGFRILLPEKRAGG